MILGGYNSVAAGERRMNIAKHGKHYHNHVHKYVCNCGCEFDLNFDIKKDYKQITLDTYNNLCAICPECHDWSGVKEVVE